MSTIRNEAGSEVRLHKKGRADTRAKREAQHSLDCATFLGLLLILLVVTGIVIGRAPDVPSSPNAVASWLKAHKSPFYFDEAKVLVRPLIKTSIENWSRQYFDPNSNCGEVGNGVWCAFGTVDTRSSNGIPAHQSWAIYFMPETKSLLYGKVGDVEAGNLKLALSRAQSQPLPDINGR